MPKRTNDFQKLIRMLTQLLGDGAVVEESKMLTDLVSGEQREVDIYAEGTLAGHTISIGIECRDQARKQHVGWVEEMRTKHERLPTDRLILVSASGFTDGAVAKANSYGIKTIAPTKASSDLAADVATSLGITMTAWQFGGLNSSVAAQVPPEWLARNAHAVAQDDGQIPLYRSDGSPLCTSNELAAAALGWHLFTHPELIATDTEVDIETPPIAAPAFKDEPVHAYWTADGEQPVLVPVATAIARAKVTVITRPVTVNPSGEITYDGNSYLTGTSPMANGQQAQIVVSDPQGQRRTQADFPVNIPPPQGENRAARRRRQRGG